ncbi:MAG: TetR/AcrR family transcriptional regulator, partial [Pseudomonadota bacterium]
MVDSTTREQSAKARRELLVAAALHCFAEKGFHQTSMRDLAERAGISLGNVYNHFGSKTDLIREIARLEADGLNFIYEELNRLDDPANTLDRFIVLYTQMCSDRGHALLSAEIISEGLRTPEICEDFLCNREVLIGRLSKIIGALERASPSGHVLAETECAEFVLDV